MNSIYNIKYFFISIIALILFTPSFVTADEFEAVLGWSKRVELSIPVNGLVEKVFVQQGQLGKKGKVLIRLNPKRFKADLKYAKAKLKNTKAQKKEAKRELDRQMDMYDRLMLSEHDLQVAKNNFIAAQAVYRQAQALLIKATLNLHNSAVRAPFDAIVIKVLAVTGQVVASSITPPILVIVAEAQRMTARFYVMIDNVNNLIIEQNVKVNIAGQLYQGKILKIALEPDDLKPRHYAVDVIFDLQGRLLRAGQKVKIQL